MYIQILLPLRSTYWKCTSEHMCGSLWNTGEAFDMLMLKEEKTPSLKKGSNNFRLDKHSERVIGPWLYCPWKSRSAEGLNQMAQRSRSPKLFQYIEDLTYAKVQRLVPPLYIGLLEGLCQVEVNTNLKIVARKGNLVFILRFNWKVKIGLFWRTAWDSWRMAQLSELLILNEAAV